MAKAPRGYLRRPAVAGFMAPQTARDLIDEVSETESAQAVALLQTEALLHRLPAPTEPVREEKVARLHLAVRHQFPSRASELLRAAGRRTAASLLTIQQSSRAQAMLSGSPWPIAAWLLGRWAQQHDWTFCGTGRFRVVTALEFEIADNPLIRGVQGAVEPQCIWHVGLFEELFRRLVSTDLECRELDCAGMGAPACRFVIARA
jgi:divinyl protochlorophyllide a 8-vinyl-reductase